MDTALLYDNAYKMLAETNVYSRPPEQLVYHDHRGKKYALLELVRLHPVIGSRRMSSTCRSRWVLSLFLAVSMQRSPDHTKIKSGRTK